MEHDEAEAQDQGSRTDVTVVYADETAQTVQERVRTYQAARIVVRSRSRQLVGVLSAAALQQVADVSRPIYDYLGQLGVQLPAEILHRYTILAEEWPESLGEGASGTTVKYHCDGDPTKSDTAHDVEASDADRKDGRPYCFEHKKWLTRV